MKTDRTLSESSLGSGTPDHRAAALGLVVVWTGDDPARLGETCLLPPGAPGPWRVFGRGSAAESDPHARANLVRVRPGRVAPGGEITNRRVSRVQLFLRRTGPDTIEFRNVGRCKAYVAGNIAETGQLQAGGLLQLGEQLVLLCSKRVTALQAVAAYPEFEFGASDPWGMIGESPAMWALRQQIADAASDRAHVLVTGASGTGKELVAAAIHGLSDRADREMICRNAATFPETLIDSELFGNLKNYPNPGTPDRTGLVGQAHGSTLFLDEIGELPSSLQARLLRVLDNGEYQRLGEATMRKSTLRVIAATNRNPEGLKHDLVARFQIRIHVPDLEQRREDISLIAQHLLRGIARRPTGEEASVDPDCEILALPLALKLLRHGYRTNVREVEALIRQALDRGREIAPDEHAAHGETLAPPPAASGALITAEQIRAALTRHRGVQNDAWRELGLSSRHALARLMRKYGIKA